MSCSVRFASHGVRVAVTSDSAAMLDAALPFLPPLRTPLAEHDVQRTFHLSSAPQADDKIRFTLHAGETTLAAAPALAPVLRALEWQVSLLVAEQAHDRIFVHAGVVEWKGKALVVPGRSFSGKSTLVAQLVRSGCAYLSDEYAILDSSGTCHAHPRSLALRVPGGFEKRTAEELGGRTRRDPLPVGAVVVTRYHEGATWRPLRLSSGQAAIALLQHTVAARARAREALAVLTTSTANVEALEGVRGDAVQLVRALLSSPS